MFRDKVRCISIHKYKCVKFTNLKTYIIRLDIFQLEKPEVESYQRLRVKGRKIYIKQILTKGKLVKQLLILDRIEYMEEILTMNKEG